MAQDIMTDWGRVLILINVAICNRELSEIERRGQRYMGSRERVEIAGRMVIVVDDGIATGATIRAALRATRKRNPKILVLAVPVAQQNA